MCMVDNMLLLYRYALPRPPAFKAATGGAGSKGAYLQKELAGKGFSLGLAPTRDSPAAIATKAPIIRIPR